MGSLQRRIAVALALLATGCGAGEGADDVEAALPGAAGEVSGPTVAADLTAAGALPVAGPPGDGSTEPEPSGESTLADGSEADQRQSVPTGSTGGPTVTVVDANLGLPLPGAELSVFDTADLSDKDAEKVVESKLRRKRFWRDAEPLASGADGTVQLPPVRDTLYVRMKLGRAEEWRTSTGADLEFVVDAEVPLPVRFVDPTGEGLDGVEVALLMPRSWQGLEDFDRGEAVGVTDGEGRMTLSTVPRYLSRLAEWRLESQFEGGPSPALPEDLVAEICDGRAYRLALRAVGMRQAPITVRQADFVPPELEIPVPAHGSLRVRLVTPAGAPATSVDRLTIRLEGDGDREAIEWEHDGSGEVLMPMVGLVQRYRIDVPHETATVAGPVRSGEEVVVQLLGSDISGVARGRLVDSAGAPLAGKPMSASYAARVDGEWSEIRADGVPQTDADGRFELDDLWRAPLSAEARELRLRSLGQSESWSIAVPLPLDLGLATAAGPLDLGDLAVAMESWSTAGVLVEEDGSARPDVSIQLQYRATSSSAWSRVTHQTTGAEGEFNLVHAPPLDGGEHRFLVSTGRRWGMDQHAFPARPGASDHVLTVATSARLELRLEFVGDLDLDSAHLAVRSKTGTHFEGPVPPAGELHTLHLDAEGEVAVVIHDYAASAMLAQVGSIEVARGQTTRDPRLLPLRVGEGLQPMRVTVVEPDGSPVRGAFVAILYRSTETEGGQLTGSASENTDRDGRADLLRAPGAVSLVVNKPGYFGFFGEELEDDMRVVLQPGGQFFVRLSTPLDEADGRFDVRVRGVGSTWGGMPLARRAGGFEGQTTESGLHELLWTWTPLEGGDPIPLTTDSTIDIRPIDGEQEFTVVPPSVP